MRRGVSAQGERTFEASLRVGALVVRSRAADERGEEDVGAVLPGQAVGVGRAVRAGAVLVLRLPRLQAPRG